MAIVVGEAKDLGDEVGVGVFYCFYYFGVFEDDEGEVGGADGEEVLCLIISILQISGFDSGGILSIVF